MTTNKYDESSITYHKEDTQKIRARPQMYIGPTDSSGIFTVLREALDNAVDEFLAGRNKRVHVFHEVQNGKPVFTVADAGVGIPVGLHPKARVSTLTIVLTSLQGGAKMDDKGGAYASSIGTHGVGIKATNALSSKFEVWTYRKDSGGWWYTAFQKGIETTKPKKTTGPRLPFDNTQTNGTVIRFTPDESLFTGKFQIQDLINWLELTSYMNAGLVLRYTSPKGKTKEYCSKRGVLDYLDKRVLEFNCEILGKPCFESNTKMDIALAWTNAEGCNVEFFTNTVRNVDGGTHANSMYDALVRSLKPYQGRLTFTSADLREGLIGVFNLKIASPRFSSQTKEKLVDERGKAPCAEECLRIFTAFWAKHKAMAKEVCKRAASLRDATNEFLKSKQLSRKIRDVRKTLPAKLGMAPNCKPEDRELYLCEGDSAAGPCKRARDKHFQEVWALKGKITNAEREPMSKIVANADIAGILASIGLDPESKSNPMDRLRVGKVIMLADPDVDGPLHPSTKVLTLDGKNPTIRQLAKQWARDKKPIWVYSRNQKGALVQAEAFEPKRIKSVTKMVHVYLDNGKVLRCSLEHKWKAKKPKSRDPRIVWNGEHGYIAAHDLRPGDGLDSFVENNNHVVAKVQIVDCEPTDVYCLTVPEYGNFMVDDGSGNGVCSSNCHINALLLTLFWRFLPKMFERGMIYVAHTPEYIAHTKSGLIIGSSPEDLYKKAGTNKITVQHVKGYGELSEVTVKAVAFDVNKRRLYKVLPPEDKKGVLEFKMIMGNDSSYRKKMLGV